MQSVSVIYGYEIKKIFKFTGFLSLRPYLYFVWGVKRDKYY